MAPGTRLFRYGEDGTSGDRRWLLTLKAAALVLAVFGMAAPARAVEVVVQNDSLAAGQQGNIQAGFVAGESAAAWLTSPCNGNIVGVQVFWRSLVGGEPDSIEDSITIFNGGVFPTPGPQLDQIVGPVLTDGVINEYRFLDDNQTIPLIVPVTNGQQFVVSFKFLNAPSPVFGPSVVTDTNGCQAGKNAIFAVPGGWSNLCSFGVSGDLVIRAVIDCNPTEACCFSPSGCLNLTVANCGIAGGDPLGPGSVCGVTPCFPVGACCNPDGSCDDGIDEDDCIASGGTYQGDESVCSGVTCPEPDGACCLANENCLELLEADCLVIPNAFWAGALTTCPDGCHLPDALLSAPGGVPVNRYMAVVVPPASLNRGPGVQTAIRVTLTTLNHLRQCCSGQDGNGFGTGCNVNSTCDSDSNCSGGTPLCRHQLAQGPPTFPGMEGNIRYVNSFPGGSLVCQDDGSPFDTSYRCATLGCDPEYRDWASDLAVAVNPAAPSGLLYITGDAMIPSSTFDLEHIAASCGATPGANTCPDASQPLAVGTSAWGDITSAAFGGPDGKADVLDIPAVVNKLKGVPTFFGEYRTWLKQRDPAANTDAITVVDLSDVQDGVLAKPYPPSRTIDACSHD